MPRGSRFHSRIGRSTGASRKKELHHHYIWPSGGTEKLLLIERPFTDFKLSISLPLRRVLTAGVRSTKSSWQIHGTRSSRPSHLRCTQGCPLRRPPRRQNSMAVFDWSGQPNRILVARGDQDPAVIICFGIIPSTVRGVS